MSHRFATSRVIPFTGIVVASALAVSAVTVADTPVAPLACPDGLAVNASGGLYVADVCTNRVLMYSPDGEWSLFAGTGDAGYSGDGGPATAADLDYVAGVTLDGMGNVHIVECGGNVIRRVSPDGLITTIVGQGGRGAGRGAYAGDGEPATDAELACPTDAAFDASGNLYITDRDNSVVRRVDPSGTISTFAGGGTVDIASASPPFGGPATEARFGPENPVQLVVDATGNVYIADEPGHRVWKIDPSGTMAAFAGTGQPGFSGDGGPALEAQLNGPYGLAIDDIGNIFIGDYENSRIRRVDQGGIISTVAGSGEVGMAGDGGPATEAQLQSPYGLVIDSAGNLYVADQENARIRVVDPEGTIQTLPS